MRIDEYIRFDAVGLAELLKGKEVTPKELAEIAFEQLNKVQPVLRPAISNRIEKVLEEAKEVKVGTAPFSGVPTMLKNGQALPGEISSSGSKILKANIANIESNFVRKLRESGFLFLGHTNTPEFALQNITEPKLYGPTRNPWNPDYSPGGSSGGAAAAVASGVVPIAGASDGGGSIRIPASFTGLFGLKPTRGKTPVGPGVGRAWQGAAVSFMLTKTVRDAAAMLDQLEGFQPEAAFNAPLFQGSYLETINEETKRPLRIAFSVKAMGNTPVSEHSKQAVHKVASWLASNGHFVEEKDDDVDGIQLIKDYYMMNSGEMRTTILSLEAVLGRKISANDIEMPGWLLNEAGKSISAADFSKSLASWDIAAAKMAKFHEEYDFYITPATAHTAPKIGQFEIDEAKKEEYFTRMREGNKDEQQQVIYDMFLPSFTYTPFGMLANLTGQPAMSIPVHLTDEGLPIGVQFLAGKAEDHQLLQIAHQIEQSNLWIGMKDNPYFAN